MKIALFSAQPYDREYFTSANEAFGHQLLYLDSKLIPDTVTLAEGSGAVCAFVNDQLDRHTLQSLSEMGVRLIALRCAGFNNVDLQAAEALGLPVVRVPAYSPYAVAEHTVALMLSLNRKLHRAYNRVREGNFSLAGLEGFDMHGKTVGVIGAGRIGSIVIRILKGFGCQILAHDVHVKEAESIPARFVELDELFRYSDIITLHCPLTPDTHHLINTDSLSKMRDGVMLINTSRGAIVETGSVIKALKSGKLSSLGLDVYEQEADLFFHDLSNTIIHDDVFERLLTFPNVLFTGHQGFFTREALNNIARTTLQNITSFEQGKPMINRLTASMVLP
ncbi:MAG: 2-hydroxyacid dehydrogenase [Gammaproteobacteria bacterium]|nr:MAG: 2-hydroxyacid dehydrogenase [Gammaproteobacteria bacterium]